MSADLLAACEALIRHVSPITLDGREAKEAARVAIANAKAQMSAPTRALEVWRVLCVSTAHLTEAERLDLNEGVTYPHHDGYGGVWWVGLGDSDAARDVSDWSEGAQEVVKIAREQGCAYVAFDPDADTIEGVVTYE